MNFLPKNKKAFLLFYFISVAVLNAYLFYNYRLGDLNIQKIELESNINKNDLLVYTTPFNAPDIDFGSPVQAIQIDSHYVFDLASGAKTRVLRIYISSKTTAYLQNITLVTPGCREILKKNDFRFVNAKAGKNNRDEKIEIGAELDGYLETRFKRFTPTELILNEFIILLSGFLVGGLLLLLFNNYTSKSPGKIDFKEASVTLFICTLFLPHPIFNVAVILSMALCIWSFDVKRFFSNRLGLLFVIYFLWFMFNNLFISSTFNSRLFETFLPVFFLPFYLSAVPRANYLKFFPISAFVLGIYYFFTSLLDAAVFSNINYFSFDGFTKNALHPVYFSYLFFFSIVYVELRGAKTFNKMVFQPVFLICLVCCGSKLVISLVALFYFMRYVKKNILLGSGILLLIVLSILMFKPTRARFLDVFNLGNLSILKADPVPSLHDPRLNGLTLRLIIWQESLSALSGPKEFLFGKGVDETADHALENRLVERGLERGHTKYDPHNQFIATYYKFGFIGLLILITICVYSFYKSMKQKDQLLFFSALLFFLAMLTESALQRVTGIYFFICILFLLSDTVINSTKGFENSDTGNKGNTK